MRRDGRYPAIDDPVFRVNFGRTEPQFVCVTDAGLEHSQEHITKFLIVIKQWQDWFV